MTGARWRPGTVTEGTLTLFSRGDLVRTSALAKRLASAIVLVPVVVWLSVGAPPWPFHAVMVALSATAGWELARMFERAGRVTQHWLTPVLAAATTASFVVPAATVPTVAVAIGVAVSGPLWAGVPPTTDGVLTTVLAIGYVGLLLGHAILLHDLPGGGALVLLVLGVTWIGESAAYFVGSAVGRRKLAPVISPNKTVEGAIAQALTSVVAGMLLASWLASWPIAVGAMGGLVIGLVGQVGDLGESVIKRSLGAKDTGAILPGHGGVLDRLDSLLFNMPAFYYLARVTGAAA